MLNFFSKSLMDTAAAGAAGNTTMSWVSTVIMIVAMLAVFYFLLYRPQKKQEKETQNMRNSLEVGDEITTIGGIIGEVVSMKDETVMIETGKDKTKIRILRGAIKSIDVKASEKTEE